MARESVADGFALIKLKVGADIADDLRRVRSSAKRSVPISSWRSTPISAGTSTRRSPGSIDCHRPGCDGSRNQPRQMMCSAWQESPARLAPIAVATGEHVANRVMFKQLLQANSISVLQLDACRVGGVNENLAILLLAAKFEVPCAHTQAALACANSSSIWRWPTSSPSAAKPMAA